MERKSLSNTEVVTVEQMTAQLAKSQTLATPEEERVLRMLHGVKSDLRAPLPRAAGANAELGDELLLMEMQFQRAARARTGVKAAAMPTTANPIKAKIVRALRKKK